MSKNNQAQVSNVQAVVAAKIDSLVSPTATPVTATLTPVSDPMAEYKAEIDRLKAENERLKSAKSGALSLKVSDKGAISVYGMGRFPTTLYSEQWLKVLGNADTIKAFIKANESHPAIVANIAKRTK